MDPVGHPALMCSGKRLREQLVEAGAFITATYEPQATDLLYHYFKGGAHQGAGQQVAALW
jgi:hypothetical protein